MPPQEYYLPKRDMVRHDAQAIIERPDVPRSTFTTREQHLTTFNAGYLIPIFWEEVYPGDHIRYNITAYVRQSTLLFPMYTQLNVETFGFATPLRILWPNFVKMMGEQPTGPADSIAFTTPIATSTAGGYAIGTVHDYFGLPTAGQVTAGQTYNHSNLPLRAYRRIYREWFRDENLQSFSADDTGDGPDNSANYVLLQINKYHDYFTSLLPWPQKFTPPTLPIGTTAPVKGIGFDRISASGAAGPFTVWENPGGSSVAYSHAWQLATATGIYLDDITDGGLGTPGIYADLSAATGITINNLRNMWMIQALLERDARGGTRYTEIVRSHFGVTSPDGRLQRPEYIGGGASPVITTPIAQTAPASGGSGPLGALGAAATSAGNHTGSYAATEHCIIVWLMAVRTELAYQQGLHRCWSRSDRYSYYWPALAHLGEQSVLRQEIYCTGVDADDATVLGYGPRYDELRQRYSIVTGLFRSTSAGNIDEWHNIQQFSAAPVLNSAFITDPGPTTLQRALAAGAAADKMQFIADILIQRTATRPLPVHGTPLALARF